MAIDTSGLSESLYFRVTLPSQSRPIQAGGNLPSDASNTGPGLHG
jgi:hypothetical protein